jgi:type II secretory pathway pseudopilin PulG
MKNRNQSGFSVVEGLLILVIVGIIGATGWYVMQANKNTNDTLNNSGLGSIAKSSKKKQTNPSLAPQAVSEDGWIVYSSKEGKFSLRYPSTWATPSHPESCAPGSLLLGANSSTVGRCGSDSGSQMYVDSSEGDQRAKYVELTSANYPDLKTESVTVDGVTGKKQAGTYKVTAEGLGPSDGDKEVRYSFYTNGRTYSASYSSRLHGVDMPDVLNDFNLMVTKTLKFSAN